MTKMPILKIVFTRSLSGLNYTKTGVGEGEGTRERDQVKKLKGSKSRLCHATDLAQMTPRLAG